MYSSHKELIDNEQLDAVSVCTYNTTHCECTVDALQAGIHVLLEKPMTVTLEEAIAAGFETWDYYNEKIHLLKLS